MIELLWLALGIAKSAREKNASERLEYYSSNDLCECISVAKGAVELWKDFVQRLDHHHQSNDRQ